MKRKAGRSRRVVLVALTLAGVAFAAAAAGELDPGFDGDGIVTTSATDGYAWATATQSSGKILVGGNDAEGAGPGWRVRRYNADGSLDTGFADHGVYAAFGAKSTDTVFDIAVDGSDRIYVLGDAGYEETVTSGKGKKKTTTTVVNQRSTIVRLDADGSVDTSFGTSGSVVLDLPDQERWSGATRLALSGGSLIVLGQTSVLSGKGRNRTLHPAIALVKLDASDGTLDSGFDGDGVLVDSLNGSVDNVRMAVAVDSGGAIYAAVWTDSSDWNVVKFSSSGARDGGFAGSSPSAGAWIQDLAVDGSDRVVAVGEIGTADDRDGIVARYGTDGELDASFGTGGSTRSGLSNWDLFGRVAIDGHGITVLGVHRVNGVGNDEQDAIVMRFDAAGDADAGFGSEPTAGLGSPIRPGGASYPTTDPGDMALDANGDVVAAGVFYDPALGGFDDWWVARWLGS
jgi:uncharacterized delta-60 repeat protein